MNYLRNKKLMTAMAVAAAMAGMSLAPAARADLVYSLELSGMPGTHSATMGANSDLTVAIFATITDANPANLINPGFYIGGGSIEASGSSGSGSIGNVNLAAGLNGSGSALGTAGDLDGDGFLDWGSTNTESGTAFFYAASATAPNYFQPVAGTKIELGTFTFHTNTFAAGDAVNLSFVPRLRTPATVDHIWYENYDPNQTTTTPLYNALDNTVGTVRSGAGIAITFPAPAGPGEWKNVTSGDFSAAGNWTGGVAPGASDTALFGTMPTAAASVRLTAPATVQGVTFNNAHSYNVYTQNASKLTIANAAGAQVSVLAGQHEISTPVALSNNTTFTVANAGDRLTISGPIDPTTATITKNGAGTLEVSRLQSGALSITGGTVRVLAGSSQPSVIGGLTIAAGATLDITNNDLIVRNGDLATIAALIASGFNNGTWDGPGIVSSAAAGTAGARVGYGLAGALGLSSFDNVAVQPGDVLIKFTFAGDANLDGTVSVSDLSILGSSYGGTATAWTSGNFNYDGKIDVSDLSLLGTNYGKTIGVYAADRLPGMTAAAVPEPTSLLLLGSACGMLLMKRKR